MYSLYYLTSTLDNKYYIGVTKNPRRRHKAHIKYTSKEKFYNGNWIRSILERGGEINMTVVLSDLSEKMAIKLEISLISLFKRLSIEITNTAEGGLGFNHKGIPHSENHKRNISLSQPHKIRIPKDVLYDLYHNQKLSKRSIGKLYGCGPTSIDRRLIEYGIQPRTTKNYKISYKLNKDEIIDLYLNKKMSMLSIANKYNIGINGIRTLLNREGIKIDSERKTPKPKSPHIEKVSLLLDQGLKRHQVSDIIGITRGHVSYLIKRYIRRHLRKL